MSTKETKFCDVCGNQMTLFDLDGDAIHSGLEIKGELTISQTEKTVCGTHHRGVFDIAKGDICSFACLAKRFNKLLIEIEAAK